MKNENENRAETCGTRHRVVDVSEVNGDGEPTKKKKNMKNKKANKPSAEKEKECRDKRDDIRHQKPSALVVTHFSMGSITGVICIYIYIYIYIFSIFAKIY